MNALDGVVEVDDFTPRPAARAGAARPAVRLEDSQLNDAEVSSLGVQIKHPELIGDARLPKPSQYIFDGHVEIATAILELGAGLSVDDLGDLLSEKGRPDLCDYVRWLPDDLPHGMKTIWRNAGRVIEAAQHRDLVACLERAAKRLGDSDRGAALADIAAELAFAQTILHPPAAAPVDMLLDMGQLHAKASNIRWAVKGAIPEASLGVIFGASGAFKSFVELDYALHRAYGMPWLGRRTRQAVPVYLAAEGGAGIMRRITAWHEARNLDWRTCPMRVVIVPLTLRTEAATLRRAIEASGVAPGDIVIDTMSQTFTGNENANDEVASYFRVIGLELRAAFNCTVTIVHHTGHLATERPRGASAIIDNVDFAMGVYRDQSEMLCTVEWAKLKEGEKPAPQTFQLQAQHLGNDEDGDPITSLAARHVSTSDEMVAAVAHEARSGRGGRGHLLVSVAHEGMRERELRKAFYEALDGLDAEGKKKAYQRAKSWAINARIFEFAGAEGRLIMLKAVA